MQKSIKKLVLMYGSILSSKLRTTEQVYLIILKKNFTYGFADHSIHGLSNDLITSCCINK